MSSHVHKGEDLKTLLRRTRAWLSGVARRRRRSSRNPQQGLQAASGGGTGDGDAPNHRDDGDGGFWTESAVDFAARADAVSCQLGSLLARV